MTNLDFFVSRWQSEYPTMLRVFQALPEDRLDYRPHPRSRTAAQLVSLLVYEEKTGIELCQTGAIRWQEPKPTSLEHMISTYQEYHTTLADQLKRLDESAWNHKAKFFVADEVVLEETVSELFWNALLDSIHHRGQLSVYIRPMGGHVPSIYGPSADEMGM